VRALRYGNASFERSDFVSGARTSRASGPQSPKQARPEVFRGSWFDRYLRSFAGTIAGGTSQIQRNIVAQHVLGLPR